MPAIVLYGRRWHFGTDEVPLPAAIAFSYHVSWALIMLVGAAATDNWPGPCDSHEGVQLAVLFATFFASFATAAAVDAALFIVGLRGAPFEVSKRRWVVPLLYLGTVPLVVQLVFTAYGTWASVALEPDCWRQSDRNAITNFAQALVFINWAFCFFAFLGAAIFFNIFPEVQERETWERRCACIASLLCCRQQMERRPGDGHRPPLQNIAELTAGLLSHVDLNATDIAAAVVLTSAAQQRRRRLRIAKALLPVYRALREQQERWGAQGPARAGAGASGVQAWSMPGEFEEPSAFEGASWQDEDSDDQEEGTDSDDAWLPSDPDLTRTLTMARAASATVHPSQPVSTAAGMHSYMSVPTPSSASARGTPPPVPAAMERQSSAGLVAGGYEGLEALEEARYVAAQSPDGTAGMTEAAAEVAADEVASGASAPAQAVDQLAAAIQKEVEELGEGPLDEAVLSIKQQESLDLATLNLQSDSPRIWFKPGSPTSSSSSAVSEAASVASTSASHPSSSPTPSASKSAHNSSVSVQDTANGAAAADAVAAGLPLQRQITLQFPTVITPSEHVEAFQGPLPPESLAEIYAGRHERCPAAMLRDATAFLRYAYAVYSLQPSMERVARGCVDHLFFRPPDPQAEVFRALGALGGLAAEPSVELLHINCSNRVLAHLPYLIALDHDHRAVVISVRGTIGVADLVTDAVVHPEEITEWLPPAVAAKVRGPALAHSGMAAAARAVFEDMTERGILGELVAQGDENGGGTAAAVQDITRSSAESGRSRGGGYQAESGGAEGSDEFHDRKSARRGAGRSGGAGAQVGDLMRRKITEEGWELVVVGHSLGAGAAALISLKLQQFYPDLRCLAFSCPGSLVSKELAHAMAPFCTTLAVGKDAVPRATVATMARLMDELITSLARCRQPKTRVLFAPWWRRHSQRFKDLFYDYKDIPQEAVDMLLRYYESRRRLGQPVPMYPPGRVIFLRPLKTRRARHWDAVFVAPEDLIGEGILVSRTMLQDHLCSRVHDALGSAAARAAAAEGAAGEEEGPGVLEGVLRWPGRAVKAQWNAVQGAAAAMGRHPQRGGQGGSLEQSLINAV